MGGRINTNKQCGTNSTINTLTHWRPSGLRPNEVLILGDKLPQTWHSMWGKSR